LSFGWGIYYPRDGTRLSLFLLYIYFFSVNNRIMSHTKRTSMKPSDPGFNEWLSSALQDIESEDSEDEVEEWNFDSNSEESADEGPIPFSEEPVLDDLLANDIIMDRSLTPPLPPDPTEVSSDDEPLESLRKKQKVKKCTYFGGNRFKWSSIPPPPSRVRSHNIVKCLPGVKGSGNRGSYCTHLSSWHILFTDEILTHIVTHTNAKLKEARDKYPSLLYHCRDTNLVEFKAFIGLLIYTGVYKSNHESLPSLFATDGTSRQIFRLTMSLRRMEAFLVCLRFDDASTRSTRKATDPIPQISWVLNKFVERCQACYNVGEFVCIDEMLISFRGRCAFRMYMPNKPGKYGLKMMILNDAKTHYAYNMYLYSGKDSDGYSLEENEKKLLKPTQSVIRLVKPIVNTNRNVTADNWFTSIELVNQLRNKGLTYLGTIKKNKRELPPEFKSTAMRLTGSSKFGFTKHISLVSYVPKQNKCVCLVSSMHHSRAIDEETNKPEIIMDYNRTKGGVDTLDQMCATYSTSRSSRRWPLTIFFAFLNISLVNSYVIWRSHPGSQDVKRAEFIKVLARALVEPHLKQRMNNLKLSRTMRENIAENLGEQLNTGQPPSSKLLEKPKRCARCPRKNDVKTRYQCQMCEVPICIPCASLKCQDCSAAVGL